MITTESERLKYSKIWTEVPSYRVRSPGELLVPYFLRWASWTAGDTLLDAGSGGGKASIKLQEAGLTVTMLDISKEGPAPEAKGIPFIEACLWELPGNLRAYDWIYCCDVLEHIPEEKVDLVFGGLANRMIKGAFFQIAMFPSTCNCTGDTLHLTLKPENWWLERLTKYWKIGREEVTADRRLICLVSELTVGE